MAGIVYAFGPDALLTPSKRFPTVTQTGGTVTIGSGGRNGGNALIFSTTGAASMTLECAATLPASIQEFWFAQWRIFNALPPSGGFYTIARARDSGSAQLELRLHSTGILSVARNGTQIAASTGFAAMPNTGYHFEWYGKIDPSAGVTTVKVNRDQKLNATGLNTRNSANSSINEIIVGFTFSGGVGAGLTSKCRDILLRDDDWNGDCRVREDLPTGTGSTDAGVPVGAATTRECVDDADPDDDATHADLQNVGDKFLLTYPSIPTDSVIKAIGVLPRVAKSAAGVANYKPALKIGTNDFLGTERLPSAGSYDNFPEFFMVSPDTGVAWTPTEANGTEIGIERTA